MQKIKSSAVLLAAGEGSRMGSIAKSLLQYNGKTFLENQLTTLMQAGIQSIHVVTGYHHAEIEHELNKLIESGKFPDPKSIRILRNPAPERGQQSSVHLALEAIDRDCDQILIALADQPLINAKDMIELIDAFANRDIGKEILYPIVDGQRGHPVLLSGPALTLYLAQAGKMSCRQFIDSTPERVIQWPTNNRHYIIDVDTPEDLNKLG